MKLYLLTRETYGYDEYIGKAVLAHNETKARQLANEHVGDEGKIWTKRSEVTCKKINPNDEGEYVILASFEAG